jgi:nucleotide-binding universal stress UspA family protein
VPLDRTDKAELALKAVSDLCDKGDEVILLSIAEEARPPVRRMRPGRVIVGGEGGPAGGVSGAARPDLPVYAESYDQTVQRQLNELEDYLRPKARELEAQGFHVSMAFEINDDPADAIADVARRAKPSFIIMVRTTHPGIGQRVFGTVAQQVIREDVAPVMILPAHA